MIETGQFALLRGPQVLADPPASRPRAAGAIQAEWLALRARPSTMAIPVVTALTFIGIGLWVSWATSRAWSGMSVAQHGSFDRVGASLVGVNLAQVIVAALGVLIVTGPLRPARPATFDPAPYPGPHGHFVPYTSPIPWARTGLFAAFALAAGTIASFTAFLGGQAILAPHGVSLRAPGALRAVIGVALYLVVSGLLGVGVGALTRRRDRGVVAVCSLLVVVPALLTMLPGSWAATVLPYLPSTAGAAIFTIPSGHAIMHPWAGLGLFCSYAAVAVFTAALASRRR